MKISKNITISKTMLERGEAVAQARGFDNFSEMVAALIREEHERRIGPDRIPGPGRLNEKPPGTNLPPGLVAAQDILNSVVGHVEQAPPAQTGKSAAKPPVTYRAARRPKRKSAA